MKKARKVQREVKKPWSKEHKSPDPNIELCKVMHSFQKSLETTCSNSKEQETTMSADTHFCRSLADRMSNLDQRSKVYVRHCIEKIFFDLEFGSMLSATSSETISNQNTNVFHP